jgi:hypothetical protein
VGDHRLFGLIWVGSFGYWQGRRAQYGPVLPGQYLRTAQIEIRLSVVCPQPQAPSLAAAAHCCSAARPLQPGSQPPAPGDQASSALRSCRRNAHRAAALLGGCSPGWAWAATGWAPGCLRAWLPLLPCCCACVLPAPLLAARLPLQLCSCCSVLGFSLRHSVNAASLSNWCFLLRFVALHLHFHLFYNSVRFQILQKALGYQYHCCSEFPK